MALAHENKEEGLTGLISFSHDTKIVAVNTQSQQCKYFHEIMQFQAQVYTTHCEYINGSIFNSTNSKRDLCTLSSWIRGSVFFFTTGSQIN